jgi:hypothetical protein
MEQRHPSVQACVGSAHGCSIISLNDNPSDNPRCSTPSPQSNEQDRELVLRNNHAEQFWSDAVEKTYQRALSETWTKKDIQAALIQASLLSYRSHKTAADGYGFRYIESAPEHYAHNCPWNDWTTPSESARLFHAASTTPYVDPVSRRIRVHVVTSADITAFATVEMNVKGKYVLVIRRGAETLASLVLRRIHLTSDPKSDPKSVDKMVLKLEISTGVPSIYLRFEDVKRLNAFIVMLSSASIESASQ